jgi:hypothetical protein
LPAAVPAIATVTAFIKARRMTHLRCRTRAGAIIIESGPKADPLPHVRLRKLASTTWAADEFHHSGRWAPLPIQAPLAEALNAIAADFSWILDA